MQQQMLDTVQQENNSIAMLKIVWANVWGNALQQRDGAVAPMLAMLTTEGVLSRKS